MCNIPFKLLLGLYNILNLSVLKICNMEFKVSGKVNKEKCNLKLMPFRYYKTSLLKKYSGFSLHYKKNNYLSNTFMWISNIIQVEREIDFWYL